MKKYTILHTIETGGPGGAETVLLHLASYIDSTRFRSLALLPSDQWLAGKLRERGIPTFLAKSRVWYDPSLPKAIAALVRKERVDLIHSHLPGQNFYSCLMGRVTGRKTLVTYHGPVELTDAASVRGGIKLWFVRHAAAAVVVVCDYVGRLLRAVGFPSEKIVRIYNGIDTDRFNIPRAGRLHKELGTPEGTMLVGTVANLRQPKGYEFFVRAARKVADTMPQVRFLAVGEIDQAIGRRLFALIEDLGLRDRFFFLGFRPNVPEILSELDVFVLASVSEGFPLAPLEAMAAGKPVVVTRSGGPEELVEDGRTGFLVPPADADALAARLCELLSDPGRATAMGLCGRAKVQSEFTLAKMVHDYEQLYERCLESSA